MHYIGYVAVALSQYVRNRRSREYRNVRTVVDRWVIDDACRAMQAQNASRRHALHGAGAGAGDVIGGAGVVVGWAPLKSWVWKNSGYIWLNIYASSRGRGSIYTVLLCSVLACVSRSLLYMLRTAALSICSTYSSVHAQHIMHRHRYIES